VFATVCVVEIVRYCVKVTFPEACATAALTFPFRVVDCVALLPIISVADVEVMFVTLVLLVSLIVWVRGTAVTELVVELALLLVVAGSVAYEVDVILALASVVF